MKRNIEILATVGPSCLNINTIQAMHRAGVDMFRINLSHTPLKRLDEIIDIIRRGTQKPICLDTEGPQIRTKGYLDGKVAKYYPEKMLVRLVGKQDPSLMCITLYPGEVIDQLCPGDTLYFGADAIPVKVTENKADTCLGIVGEDLYVRGNMAVTSKNGIKLPPLTEKDILALEIAKKKNVRNFALSYAKDIFSIRQIRTLVGYGPKNSIIAKIETRDGVLNIDGILSSADAILIDRGDMGKEINPLMVPRIQKYIVRKAKKVGKPVYVATNLLESMVDKKRPTAAEMNDVYNTLCDGVDGLVLAAETAIGKYPVECVKMVKSVIGQYQHLNAKSKHACN